MGSRRIETLADLVTDLVAERPRSGFEICRALEEDENVSLRGRESVLYAALLQLVREGFLTSEVEETEVGPRRIYRLPVLADVGGGRP